MIAHTDPNDPVTPHSRSLLKPDEHGLTKREHFALELAKGLLASQLFNLGTSIERREAIANESTELADLIIRRLNQTNR